MSIYHDDPEPLVEVLFDGRRLLLNVNGSDLNYVCLTKRDDAIEVEVSSDIEHQHGDSISQKLTKEQVIALRGWLGS